MRRFALALTLLATALPALGQEAYFAPYEDCEARAMAVLDEAQQTLDVAQYNIRNERFVTKLEELRARGVRIRIVVDAKQAEKEYNTLDDAIRDKGFDIVPSRNTSSDYAIMHHKFSVIDGRTVMTGSYNWNETAQNVNDENMLVFRDPALAAAYAQEFEELRGAPVVAQPGQGQGVTVYFSPEDKARDAVVAQCKAAKRSIQVCMFTFKDGRVAAAMRDAARRGVKVLLVAEKKQADTTNADEVVAQGGPSARVIIAANTSAAHSAMHQKFAVFDGERVITGACNWTSTAFNHSNEDLLVIESPALARRYTQAVGDIVARYAPKGFDPAPFGIERPTVWAHFVVRCNKTYLGEAVAIVGNHPALGLREDGTWDSTRTQLVLRTTDTLFPTWFGRVQLPAGHKLQFKAVVVNEQTHVTRLWEREGMGDRVLSIDPRGTYPAVVIDFDDGSQGDLGDWDGGEDVNGPAAPTGTGGGIIDAIPGQ